jgi:hypothetical protein
MRFWMLRSSATTAISASSDPDTLTVPSVSHEWFSPTGPTQPAQAARTRKTAVVEVAGGVLVQAAGAWWEHAVVGQVAEVVLGLEHVCGLDVVEWVACRQDAQGQERAGGRVSGICRP